MKSLREYLDIIQQLDERITINPDGTTSGGLARPPAPAAPAAPASASPWANDPAKDAAWKALSPEDQKWLGAADPTDKFILARAPKKGAPAPVAPAAAAPTAPASAAPAAPAATSAATGVGNPGEEAAAQAAAPAPAMTAADQEDADMGAAMAANAQAANGVNTAGQNVTMPDGTNPETGEKTTVASAAQAAPAGQGASPAAPANRDAMPFGKAFADAKAKGESQFTWKGKPYAVQLAKPAAAAPAPYNAAKDSQKANVGQAAALAAPNQSSAETARLARQSKPTPVKESAPSYDEVQRLIGLVHYR